MENRVVRSNSTVALETHEVPDSMHRIRRILREVTISLAGVAVLMISGLSLISQTCAQEVCVIKLLGSVTVLRAPVLNFHPACPWNPRKAIAAKPALFAHKGGPQSVLVGVVVVICMGAGTMQGKTGRLSALANRSHALDSRNIINAR